MSAETNLIIEVTPRGNGQALDLAGGQGILRQPLERLGYRYFNLDIQQFRNGEPSVVGDAHTLPFGDACFDLVVCKEALTNFAQPWIAVKDVYRVLKPGGLFIISTGFMWPFTESDFYRYSPLGLRHLLGDFEIVSLESPHSVFTMLSSVIIEGLRRLHLGFTESPIKSVCHWLDRWLIRLRKRPSSFAAGYRVVARKRRNEGYEQGETFAEP